MSIFRRRKKYKVFAFHSLDSGTENPLQKGRVSEIISFIQAEAGVQDYRWDFDDYKFRTTSGFGDSWMNLSLEEITHINISIPIHSDWNKIGYYLSHEKDILNTHVFWFDCNIPEFTFIKCFNAIEKEFLIDYGYSYTVSCKKHSSPGLFAIGSYDRYKKIEGVSKYSKTMDFHYWHRFALGIKNGKFRTFFSENIINDSHLPFVEEALSNFSMKGDAFRVVSESKGLYLWEIPIHLLDEIIDLYIRNEIIRNDKI